MEGVRLQSSFRTHLSSQHADVFIFRFLGSLLLSNFSILCRLFLLLCFMPVLHRVPLPHGDDEATAGRSPAAQ